MDRRTFVRGCIAAGGAAAAAAAGFAAFRSAVPARATTTSSAVTYYGLHKVGGPAPRGLPLVPIAIEDGMFVGQPEKTGPDGQGVLLWYDYCGAYGSLGLSADYRGDNILRFTAPPAVLAQHASQGIAPWYASRLGEPMRPEDFAPGAGAPFTWRQSGAQQGPQVLAGVLIRAPRETAWTPADREFAPPRYVPPAIPLSDADWSVVRSDYLSLGDTGRFVAAASACTHFCTRSGWEEALFAKSIPDPINGGSAWDCVFCPSHGSIFEPFQLARYSFTPTGALPPV
ncbi:MAG: hypothetical protein ACYDDF_12050 [Thermoplasmatota archaeon]